VRSGGFEVSSGGCGCELDGKGGRGRGVSDDGKTNEERT
jgi:hypothetical protein